MTDLTKYYPMIMGAGVVAGLLVLCVSSGLYWWLLMGCWSAVAVWFGVTKLLRWMDRTFGW